MTLCSSLVETFVQHTGPWHGATHIATSRCIQKCPVFFQQLDAGLLALLVQNACMLKAPESVFVTLADFAEYNYNNDRTKHKPY